MLVVEFAAFLGIGAVSGLLAGLFGVGGGVVVVPSLIFLFSHLGVGGEWIPHMAVGTSLASIVGTGAASTYAHHQRQSVRWDLFARLVPGIILGAWLGSMLAGFIPDLWLKRIFAAFLLFVGIRMILQLQHRSGDAHAGFWQFLGAGTGIGTASSLVGIGGGTLTVPYLSSRGIDLRQAVGTSSACGIPLAFAGACGFVMTGWGREGLPAMSSGFVYWPAVIGILLVSMPMAPLGARLAHTLPVSLLKRIFGILLVVVSVRMATSG